MSFDDNKERVSCGACMSTDYSLVKYTIDNKTWKSSIYCADCIGEIRRTRWLMLKDSVSKVDCLASLRNIRTFGIPMTLIERDLGATNDMSGEVLAIRDADRVNIPTALDVDLTAAQRDSLVHDLNALNIDTVTDLDIRTVCAKYWPDIDQTQAVRPTRPTFIVGNRPYVSAGVLLYTEDKGQYHFLIQRTHRDSWRYEDFGGKSDVGDVSIQDVAIRECLQETNGICTSSILLSGLTDRKSIVYPIPECKYMLYIIYVPPTLKANLREFGTHEIHDAIKRDVLWLSYKTLSEIPEADIHPRIVAFKRDLPLLLANALF